MIELFLIAPVGTRILAASALASGLVGTILAVWRAIFLLAAAVRLRAVLDAKGGHVEANSGHESAWDALTECKTPSAFKDTLWRLERERAASTSAPEDTWRAAFELVVSNEARWEAHAKAFASAAVLLGLFGTVLGFAELSSEIMPFAAGPPISRLRVQLGGVFIATLSGISGSLLVLLFGSPFLRTAVDRWANVVEDIGRLVLVPSLPRPPIKVQDVVVQELGRRLDAIASTWKAALEPVAQAFQQLIDDATESVKKMREAFAGVRVSVEDLKELGNSSKKIRVAAESIEKSAGTYASSVERLSGVADRFDRPLVALTLELTEQNAKLAALEQAVRAASGDIQASGETLRIRVDEMSSKFVLLTNIVSTKVEQDSRVARQAAESIAAIHTHLVALSGAQQRMLEEANRMSLAIAGIADVADRTLSPLPQQLGNALRETFGTLLRDHVNGLLAAIDYLRQSVDAVNTAAGVLGVTTRDIIVASEELRTESEGLRDGAREMKNALEIVNEARSAVDRLTSTVEMVVSNGIPLAQDPKLDRLINSLSKVSEATTNLRDQLEGLVRRMGTLEDNLGRFFDRLERLRRNRQDSHKLSSGFLYRLRRLFGR